MPLCIIQDTREQAPYTFACITPPPLVEVATLASGDYSIKGLEDKVAIERKSKKGSDVGESVQILGDVDGMVILDKSDEEERMLRMRVGTSVQRDDRRSSKVMVLQCLELGQAVVRRIKSINAGNGR